jgi:GMP synthase (glutamine-hydrolysing)
MKEQGIAVLDFGSQYTQTIARKVRHLGVFSEILEPEIDIQELEQAVGIIGSGGPASVYEHGSPKCEPKIWKLPIPKLAICYAFQLYADENGGKTIPSESAGEYGKAELLIKQKYPIFENLPKRQVAWMSHGDKVSKLPLHMKRLALTDDCEFAAAWDPRYKVVGVQFHPEVDDTEYGKQILGNFLKACKPPQNQWNYERFIAEAPNEIHQTVKDRKVAHLTSGGKDSSVAAILLKEALNENVSFLHINCGIERKNEVEDVRNNLRDIGIEPVILDTSEELERELTGMVDAEEKRAIIGRHYIRHAQRWAETQYGNEWIIGQGTIYPDHIESQGTKHSALIKTHHNRVAEVLDLINQNKMIEPNLYLFKDDIEAIARILGKQPEYSGLARIFAPQHPFPGPGLAIRMLCSNGTEPANLEELTEDANKIANKYDVEAKALPVYSVGVQGDGRTYTPPVAVWGVSDWETLDDLSTNITNNMRGRVNRVVYLWSPSEIKSLKLHEAYVTKERLDRLREADAIVMNALEKTGEMKNIKQCPTISLPISLNNYGSECIVVRPFKTKEFMTGSFGRLPADLINDVAADIHGLDYSGLLYDVTNKPPGTTEWE